MNSRTLNFEDVFQVDPDSGRISLGSERYLLLYASAFGSMRRELIENLGWDVAAGVLERVGFRAGQSDARQLRERFPSSSDEEWLLAGPRLHYLEGIVKVAIGELKVDRKRGLFYMTGDWLDSYEADQHIQYYGTGERPVCWTLEGYATGYASEFFGEDVICLERRCRGKGDPLCSFEIRPDREWGEEAASVRQRISLDRYAERKLAESRFRNLLESAPDAIVIVNAEGRVVLINAQTEKMFGYSRAELLGEPVEKLVPTRHRKIHRAKRSEYLTRPGVRHMGGGLELSGLRKDGTEFPIEISLSPIETEEGVLVSSAIRDITERKVAESKFRSLLEAAPDAMVIVDTRGRMVLVNAQTEKMFGYRRAELIGEPVEKLMPTRHRGRHVEHRFHYFKSPTIRPMGVGLDLVGRRKDGTEFPLEISLSPLETEEGTLVSSSIRDITERKRAEEALQRAHAELEMRVRERTAELRSANESLQREIGERKRTEDELAAKDRFMANILQDSADAIITLDPNDIVTSWNRGAELIYGYSAQEMIGQSLDPVLPPELRNGRELAAIQQKLQTQGAIRNYQTERMTKDGRRIQVILTRTAIRDAAGRFIGSSAVAKDVTSYRSLERQLAYAEHIVMLGELAAGLAHEIKNPLAGIKGAIEVIRDAGPQDEPNRAILGDVLHEVSRIDKTVRDLLTYAKPKDPSHSSIHLDEMVSRLLVILRQSGRSDSLSYAVHCSNEIPGFTGDESQIEQVLLNLLLNAQHATPAGRKIDVMLSHDTETHTIIVEVLDEGPGVPAELRRKIFQPFFTTRTEGTGLGLATCLKNVQYHGGTIEVLQRQRNGGARFVVKLPLLCPI